jgi:hypothetical protein
MRAPSTVENVMSIPLPPRALSAAPEGVAEGALAPEDSPEGVAEVEGGAVALALVVASVVVVPEGTLREGSAIVLVVVAEPPVIVVPVIGIPQLIDSLELLLVPEAAAIFPALPMVNLGLMFPELPINATM